MWKIFSKLMLTIALIFGSTWVVENIINKPELPRHHEWEVKITVKNLDGSLIAEETAMSRHRYLGEVIDDFNDGIHEGLYFDLEGWSLGRTVNSINGVESSWTGDFFAISSPTNKWCAGFPGDFGGPDDFCQKGIDGLSMDDKSEEFVFTHTMIIDEN